MESRSRDSDTDQHEPASVPNGVSGLDSAHRSASDGQSGMRLVRKLSTFGGSALVLGILAVVTWSFLHATIAGPHDAPLAPFDTMHPAVTGLYPSAVALDGAGNLYVLNKGELPRIVKVTPAGTTLSELPVSDTTDTFGIAPGGQPFTVEFDIPSAVAGAVVSGQQGSSWTAITPDRFINDIIDSALAIDTRGVVYLGGTLNGSGNAASPFVHEYTRSGKLVRMWMGKTNDATEAGMAVDRSGNVYLGDQAGNRLQSFTPAGKLRWTWTKKADFSLVGISWPPGVALDRAGNVYMAGNATFQVEKISPSGRWLSAWPVPRGTSAFNMPTSLAVDRMGSVYVVDVLDNTEEIFKYSASGKPLAIWR